MKLLISLDPNHLKILNDIINLTIPENNNFTTIALTKLLLLPVILFSIGVIGVVLNRKNLIFLMLSLELMLLAITLNFIFFSVFLHDSFGQIYALMILTLAAAESAIGLGILVVTFRVKKTIDFRDLNYLRG